MARTKGVNQRMIHNVLSSCAFSPTKVGPMKVIADVGDPQYYVKRAIEILQLHLTNDTGEIRKAMALLALATAEIELNNDP